jgi:hypothetical protein
MKQVTRRRAASGQAEPAGRLQEEIALIEKRLQELGPDGDCGYENAMIRFYERELGRRRAQLGIAEH